MLWDHKYLLLFLFIIVALIIVPVQAGYSEHYGNDIGHTLKVPVGIKKETGILVSNPFKQRAIVTFECNGESCKYIKLIPEDGTLRLYPRGSDEPQLIQKDIRMKVFVPASQPKGKTYDGNVHIVIKPAIVMRPQMTSSIMRIEHNPDFNIKTTKFVGFGFRAQMEVISWQLLVISMIGACVIFLSSLGWVKETLIWTISSISAWILPAITYYYTGFDSYWINYIVTGSMDFIPTLNNNLAFSVLSYAIAISALSWLVLSKYSRGVKSGFRYHT